ncbi:MAG TPA: type II secretion system protein [Smithella sp.]|nr:type II secretion system protein [Smithella sp.]
MLAKHKPNGFTLLEVIITLMVAAIVGTMMYTTLGKSLSGSSEPIFRMQKSFALQQVMENMITAYDKICYDGGDIEDLKIAIGAEGATMNNGFGQYTVVENRFIKFEANVQKNIATGELHNLLKVTIKNSNNERLSYIFTG